MYIDHIDIENFRSFRNSRIDFCHQDRDFEAIGIPKPRLPNINLLLADNGFGKTSVLKAVALVALGPAVARSGIYPYRLVRREANGQIARAVLRAEFTPHKQDHSPVDRIESHVEVVAEGDIELLNWGHTDDKRWHPVFQSNSDAMFMVGYGATRRVSRADRFPASGTFSPRAGRIRGLFEEDHSLRPLNTWLPSYKANNRLRGRYTQVKNLLNRLAGTAGWKLTDSQDEESEYLYRRADVEVPFPALSDGYRAFLGWLGDLLYHVCETCPKGKMLYENRGIVMVDEIDLHLHPAWQMTVLNALAEALPNVQFIVTSHSPLLVGSIEWMNVILMEPGERQSSQPRRLEHPVHGLNADQILTSEFFGMKSTRAPSMRLALKDLSRKAQHGDIEASKQILEQMSRGMEIAK